MTEVRFYAGLENPTLFTSIGGTYAFQFQCCQTVDVGIRVCPVTGSNQYQTDFEVLVVPITEAKPGFDVKYKVLYRNKGNFVRSGSLNLNFDDSVLDVVSSTPAIVSQSTNTLNWTFASLKPFEVREVLLTMHLNSPTDTPAVTEGYVLNFTAQINLSAGTDFNTADNTFVYHQTVVNAFDPNNKTCLEGAAISTTDVGKYVHYLVRFENNGSANAQKVIIVDKIDLAKF